MPNVPIKLDISLGCGCQTEFTTKEITMIPMKQTNKRRCLCVFDWNTINLLSR